MDSFYKKIFDEYENSLSQETKDRDREARDG